MDNKQIDGQKVLAIATRNGFERDVTWELIDDAGYPKVRVHGWTPGAHCWSFMDLDVSDCV